MWICSSALLTIVSIVSSSSKYTSLWEETGVPGENPRLSVEC